MFASRARFSSLVSVEPEDSSSDEADEESPEEEAQEAAEAERTGEIEAAEDWDACFEPAGGSEWV